MTDDILKQAEDIMEKKEWEEFWRQYEEAVSREDWKAAYDLLEKTLLPHLYANHNKMVEYLKQKDELIEKYEKLINKYKELAESSEKTIKHYEGIINEYESRGGQ